MALHVADEEVSELMNRYSEATGLNKTEALRRLLKFALREMQNPIARIAFTQSDTCSIKLDETAEVEVFVGQLAERVFQKLFEKPFSINEAARYLALPISVVRRLSATKKLKPIDAGSENVQFDKAELDRFIDAHKEKRGLKFI